MQFQEAFPELKATPPQVPGQVSQRPSVLHQLRRQQLEDLGRAYGIAVSGTKQQMMPLLLDAEARGVFRGQPLDPYYLMKAARSPDDRGQVLEGQPKPERASQEAVPVEEIETEYQPPVALETLHIGRLRKVCSQQGMKMSQRVTRQEMLAWLREQGIDTTRPIGDA